MIMSFSRKTEEIHAQKILFLSEQDGPSEQLLKEKLIDYFNGNKAVNTAYLVRMSIGNEGSASVALGLSVQFGPDKDMVDKISQIFASIFNAKEHLDVLFLTSSQEVELKKVCGHFFKVS